MLYNIQKDIDLRDLHGLYQVFLNVGVMIVKCNILVSIEFFYSQLTYGPFNKQNLSDVNHYCSLSF
jgi:hypothetical protein